MNTVIDAEKSKLAMKSRLKTINLFVGMSEMINDLLKDINNIDDPVLKFTFICTGFKLILTTALKTGIVFAQDASDDLPLTDSDRKIIDDKEKRALDSIKESINELTKLFDMMNKWIRSPVYSPIDHPNGVLLMNTDKEHFDTLKAT